MIKTRLKLGVKKLRVAIVAIGSLESFEEVGLRNPHETNG